MYYYKNMINDELCGLTTAPYEVTAEGFFEITEEEYLNLGGRMPGESSSDEKNDVEVVKEILDAFIE